MRPLADLRVLEAAGDGDSATMGATAGAGTSPPVSFGFKLGCPRGHAKLRPHDM